MGSSLARSKLNLIFLSNAVRQWRKVLTSEALKRNGLCVLVIRALQERYSMERSGDVVGVPTADSFPKT